MIKKRCLFCDKIVPSQPEGDYDRYINCLCSPEGSYKLLRSSYDPIQSLPHQQKRDMLHLISAYIREQTDCGEQVALTAEDLEAITNSPKIPVTIEDKGIRLLKYLYRHSEGAEDPVVIQPLSSSYNLTYSHNLQELVYILDKLGSEQLIIREGMTFKLTEKGWREAAAAAGGKKLKPCFILLSGDKAQQAEWEDKIMPKMEQLGYLPRIFAFSNAGQQETYSLEQIREGKWIIAELSGHSADVYFAAGYGLALGIPVIWSLQQQAADSFTTQIKEIRPIVWEKAEDLAILIQQKLNG